MTATKEREMTTATAKARRCTRCFKDFDPSANYYRVDAAYAAVKIWCSDCATEVFGGDWFSWTAGVCFDGVSLEAIGIKLQAA